MTDFTFRHVLSIYAHPVIFLFLGGFLIAGAMQKWKLDQRFTLWFLTRGKLANDSRAVLFGIMVVTAFLSMWISNTATTAVMLPLGLGILTLMKLEPGKSRYGTALMPAIAWSASVEGSARSSGHRPMALDWRSSMRVSPAIRRTSGSLFLTGLSLACRTLSFFSPSSGLSF